jgi:non-ribosomal peptide synthetase component F
VSDLTILPETEWKQLVEGWNSTAAPYPAQACLHQLFEQQVERTPETVAVTSGEEQSTYLQLNLRANQLAHFLQEQVLAPITWLACVWSLPVQMVIALLGSLKQVEPTCRWIPLPEKRLAFMLTDARPVLLLTRGLRTRLPDFTGDLVCLDADEDRLRQQRRPIQLSGDPDHLAYVMYTSGSTGTLRASPGPLRVVNLLTDFQRHARRFPQGCVQLVDQSQFRRIGLRDLLPIGGR